MRRPEIVLKEASTIFDHNSEEINQVSILCYIFYLVSKFLKVVVSQDGKYLAACDDSGEAKIIDIEQGKLAHTLARRHKNVQ